MPGRAKPCSGASPLAGVGMLISRPKKRGLCSRRFWNRPKPEVCWWWLPSKRRIRKPSCVPFIPRWCTARSIAKGGARSYRAPGTRRPAKKSARRSKKLPQIVQEQIAAQADSPGQTLPVRLMFEDEARFGRISDPRRCWAPAGMRPEVEVQMVREYEYAFAAVSPHDGVLDTRVLPTVNAEGMGVFLAEVAQRHPNDLILMVLDGAGWHRAKRLQIPANL